MIENTRVNPALTIDIAGARRLADEGAFIVDVRDEGPFRQAHVPNAVNVPLLDLPEWESELPADKAKPILAICQRGNLSLSAVLYLKSLGFENAWSVTGGTNAWIEEGHEVVAS